MQAYTALKCRGLLYQTSQFIEEALKSIAINQSIYLGVDPTAKGLHVGHLIACKVLKRFHESNINCIALVGGATALIGDPSFKALERNILSFEDVQNNVIEIQKDIERVLESTGDKNLQFVNNYDWYKQMNSLIYRNMRVQSMLSKDSVQKRIVSEDSMSFAEFSYQALQSSDYLYLHNNYGCICQIGGSDQWGNITSGIDLVKRVTGHSVHGLTVPLLTASNGQKFGKSEGNAIWLNKSRTSNNDFYQFFLRQDDSELAVLFRFLTDLPETDITDILAEHMKRPEKREAQRILADVVMKSIRSVEDLKKAQKCAEILYEDHDDAITFDMISDILDELPLQVLSRQEMAGKSVVDYLVDMRFTDSKKSAKRLIQGGGVYVNGISVQLPSYIITEKDLLDRCILPLRVGKKNRKFAVLK